MARATDNQLKKLTTAVKTHKAAFKAAEKELKLYKSAQIKAAKTAKSTKSTKKKPAKIVKSKIVKKTARLKKAA